MGGLLFSGGVLFAIVLEACPIADNKKEGLNGGTATIKAPTVLQGLAQISGIARCMPSSADASEYKKCTAQGAMHLQTSKFIQDFEKNITTKYDELYQRTVNFVCECFFDSRDEHEAVAERLFYALKLSKNIPDKASFIYLNGTITKEDLLALTEIDLPALILAIWFYCIKNIPNNRKGENLFKHLFENAGSGNIYHFNGTIDNPYKDTLTVNTGNPDTHNQYDLPPLETIIDDDTLEKIAVKAGTAAPEEQPESAQTIRVDNPSQPAQGITFNFTVNGDNANVRNIVNNGTYIEGSEDKDE